VLFSSEAWSCRQSTTPARLPESALERSRVEHGLLQQPAAPERLAEGDLVAPVAGTGGLSATDVSTILSNAEAEQSLPVQRFACPKDPAPEWSSP